MNKGVVRPLSMLLSAYVQQKYSATTRALNCLNKICVRKKCADTSETKNDQLYTMIKWITPYAYKTYSVFSMELVLQ